MKLIYKIAFFVFFVFTTEFCPSKQIGKGIVLSIDFQDGFDHDIVELIYNKDIVYKDTITTDNVIGLANSVKIRVLKENDLIYLKIRNENYSIQSFGFTPNIGITHIPGYDTIRIIYSSDPFFYD